MATRARVEIGPKGRIVIPAAVREELGLREGVSLLLRVHDGSIMLVPPDTLLRRLHAITSDVPNSMADELIGERHYEAMSEDKE